MKKGQHVIGGIQLRSSLSIEILGDIISKEILGGVKLDGLEKNIYDEVPAIFCGLLGFSVVLHGYQGMDKDTSYWFDLVPNFSSDEDEKEIVDLSVYMVSLFRDRFKNHSNIEIVI